MLLYKTFCPRCRKTWKGRQKCCGSQTIHMGTRWRFPKPNDRKIKWRKNLNKLIWCKSMNNVADLRKLYDWCGADLKFRKTLLEARSERFLEKIKNK